MKSRIYTRKKSTREQIPDTTAQAQPMFQSRPFGVQTQTTQQSQQPDLKTSLMRAERYGHHLSGMHPAGVSAATTVKHKEGKDRQEASEREKAAPVFQTKLIGTQEVIQRSPDENENLVGKKVKLQTGETGTVQSKRGLFYDVQLEEGNQNISVGRFQIKEVLSEREETQQESLVGSSQMPMSVTSGQQSGVTKKPPPPPPPRRTGQPIPVGSTQTPQGEKSSGSSGTTTKPLPPRKPEELTKKGKANAATTATNLEKTPAATANADRKETPTDKQAPSAAPKGKWSGKTGKSYTSAETENLVGSSQMPMSVTSGQQSGVTKKPPPPCVGEEAPSVGKEAQGGGVGQMPMKLAERFLMQVQQRAADPKKQHSLTSKATVETRQQITAPEDDILIVYRAEKAERNNLEDRRKQGGLNRWKPTSKNVQEAYDVMRQEITTFARGENISQEEWNRAVDAYAQKLRAQGQVDALATARTIEGAFESDFNYKIKIPGVKLFKWEGGKKGEQILPGEEIKKHYIVLNADKIADSTIFGIGHVTGTQEVTFYSDIPGDTIESVQERTFEAELKKFRVPEGAKRGD